MRKLICLVGVLATVGFASVAVAGELSVKIANGRATVIAKDVPIRQILAEWGRVGETKMVHIEKMVGGPVTLELIDVPEKEALDILLAYCSWIYGRAAAGECRGGIAVRPRHRAGHQPAAGFKCEHAAAGVRPPRGPADHAAAARRRRWGAGRPGNAPPVMGPNGPNPAGLSGTGHRAEWPSHRPQRRDHRTERPADRPNGPMGPNGMPTQPATTSPRPGQIPQAQPGTFPPNPWTSSGRATRTSTTRWSGVRQIVGPRPAVRYPTNGGDCGLRLLCTSRRRGPSCTIRGCVLFLCGRRLYPERSRAWLTSCVIDPRIGEQSKHCIVGYSGSTLPKPAVFAGTGSTAATPTIPAASSRDLGRPRGARR